MTPPISVAEAQAPLTAKPAKTARAARRPVVPVIPLQYMKKKPVTPSPAVAPAIIPQEVLEEKVPTSIIHATLSSPSSPVRHTVEIQNSTPEKEGAEDKKEENIQTTVELHSEPTLFDVKEAVKYSNEEAKLVSDSDKSSTLANESRPATTEPISTTPTTTPPHYSVLQGVKQQQDDISRLTNRDANGQFLTQYVQPGFGLRVGHDAPHHPNSRSFSPPPAVLGESQSRYPLQGPTPISTVNGHSRILGNGFPMGPPPPPGIMHPHLIRQMQPPLPSPDGYSPSLTPGFSDQQRFPSYPSSVHNEFEGNAQQFHSGAPNGINGHANGLHVNTQARPVVNGSHFMGNGDFVSHHHMPPQIPPHSMNDHLDGLLEYLLAQVGNPNYADYTLELHYSDGRASPVRIPGHNLLFARSPVLNNLMATTTGQLSVDGSKRLLRLETDDRFVTSDGFHMAVSRLYGGRLLDEGGPSMTRAPGHPEALIARFDFALGYAASGHVLHIPPVVDRGIMVAAELISWETVEKAINFAIDGGLDSHWTLEPSHNGYSRSTYGRIANDLLSSALNFALRNFPADFYLDTSVPDFAHNSRLPVIQAPSIQSSRPLTAHPRLSSIKFGDLSIHDDDYNESSSPSYVLSKLLINLPFPLLNYVLEHRRFGNMDAWASMKLREEVIKTVVEEREKRRMKILNSPVRNSKRIENRTNWEAVGWCEYVISSPDSPDRSTIARTWVDFIFPSPKND